MIIYTTEYCAGCYALKDFLKENNIDFKECKDIEKMRELGIRSVPSVIDENNNVITGNDIYKYVREKKSSKRTTDARQIMSDAKFYEGYSRYIDDQNRYETWDESVARVMNMHREKYKDIMTDELEELIKECELGYKDKLFLGAQRALQYGGDQLFAHNARLYNCSSTYANRPDFFKGLTYLLLCGAGVGFSVQKHHIKDMPKIKKPSDDIILYKIPDSIEGWSMAVDNLIYSYFDLEADGTEHDKFRGKKIIFDYSEIRPKGAFVSGGFKAPGPDPLEKAIKNIRKILDKAVSDSSESVAMEPIDVYDIAMHIADAVISGGVRRSATICMFSKDDEKMIKAKTGDWYVTNPQRGRSNNSVMLLKDETAFEEFEEIMQSVKDSGEPGFIFVDDLDIALNPCVEVGMYPKIQNVKGDYEYGFAFCNLTEINGAKSISEEIFYKQCKLASILGTIQAGYTDFEFLTDKTKDIVEAEALIGVGITGMMNNPDILFNPDVQQKGAEIVKKWNKKVAEMINIEQASRTTVIKPSGNASVILGCSSGIHGEHSKKYFRHTQFNKDTEVAKLFMENNPEMCEDSVWNNSDVVVAFPIESPDTSLFKSELLGTKQLEYVRTTQQNWIEHGTNWDLTAARAIPELRHNVSNTITVDDWDEVTKYIYNNRQDLCGVSLLAASGDKAYPQAPFTEVLDYKDVVEKYGVLSLFTSALIEVGMEAFNNDLWRAINTALGYGETLGDSHEFLLKRDFVRRFKKFATNFDSLEECANCLKDTYNLHKWWKIQNSLKEIKWENELKEKTFTDVDTMAAQACHGGSCDI